jgi:PTH1 family peptidyl-tRNA hydrolase
VEERLRRLRLGEDLFPAPEPDADQVGPDRPVLREVHPRRADHVIYDDLDLPEGRLRIRPQGSHGGNNGLKSIASAVGSTDFGRIRLGVGRPWRNGMPSWDQDAVIDWLLHDPPRQAQEVLDEAVQRVADAIEKIIRDGWERAMDTYNRV